jgi:predicted nucleic acid-binding protein
VIAADTSVVVEYLAGGTGADVELLDRALFHGLLVFPPVVLSEILCAKGITPDLRTRLVAIPRLDILEGYWERAGETRAGLFARRLKARLADTLVAQSCIDHQVPLLTRDKDFRHFAKHCGLHLAR